MYQYHNIKRIVLTIFILSNLIGYITLSKQKKKIF